MLKSSQPILQCLLYLDICMFHLCFTNKNLKLFMLLQSSYLACLFSLVEKKPAKSFNRELSYFFLFLVFQELPSLADLFDKNMFKVITLNEYIFLDKNKKILSAYTYDICSFEPNWLGCVHENHNYIFIYWPYSSLTCLACFISPYITFVCLMEKFLDRKWYLCR